MSQNPFSHIDLRVRNFDEVTEFYREFLPAVGFTEQWEGETWRGNSTLEAFPAKAFFGFTEDPAPGAERNLPNCVGHPW